MAHPKLGDHIRCGDKHGIYTSGNQVITYSNGYIVKETFNSSHWNQCEVFSQASCNYHIVAEQMYDEYRGKKYSTVVGFINDVINKTHGRSDAYKIFGYMTLGVGTSFISSGVEAGEMYSEFVDRGDNVVTKTARAVVFAPVFVGQTIIKAPIFLLSKLFS